MKLSTKLIATCLLSLFCVATAGAHDPDELKMRYPTQKKEVPKPATCSELDNADKHMLNMSDPDITALDKQCKAEAAAAKKKADKKK